MLLDISKIYTHFYVWMDKIIIIIKGTKYIYDSELQYFFFLFVNGGGGLGWAGLSLCCAWMGLKTWDKVVFFRFHF